MPPQVRQPPRHITLRPHALRPLPSFTTFSRALLPAVVLMVGCSPLSGVDDSVMAGTFSRSLAFSFSLRSLLFFFLLCVSLLVLSVRLRVAAAQYYLCGGFSEWWRWRCLPPRGVTPGSLHTAA